MQITADSMMAMAIKWFPDIGANEDLQRFRRSTAREIDVYSFLPDVIYRAVLIPLLDNANDDKLQHYFAFVEALLRDADANLFAAVQLRLIPYLRASYVWDEVGDAYAGPLLRAAPY